MPKFDPRVKLVSTMGLVIAIAATPQYAWMAYPLMWTVLGGLAIFSGLSPWRVGKLAGVALPFTLAALPLMVTLDGKPIAEMLGFTVTDVGLAAFLAIVLKSWLSANALMIFTLTTPFTDLLMALENLRVPRILTSTLSVMYRYLYTLKDEAERLLRARAARSSTISPSQKSGGSLLWRAKTVGGMVGNLFLRSYERSERVHAAMLARGYNGALKSAAMPPLTLTSVVKGAIPVLLVLIIQIIVRL